MQQVIEEATRRTLAAGSPDLIAITVTYNSADVLDEFLDCVQSQRGNWRLVIIDNASTDGTRERLGAISDGRIHVILSSRNTGFAAGSNQGIVWALQAGAKAVLLINNDTSFAPDLFQRLFDKLRADAGDAVSPVILFESDPNKVWYAGGSIQWSRAVRNVHDHSAESVTNVTKEDFSVGFFPLCCAAIKREVFERIGLIDEDYFVYWEDVDFSYRMNVAGLRSTVAPGVTILHKGGALTGGLMSDFSTRQYYKNRVIFVRKTLGPVGCLWQFGLIGAAVVGRTLFKGDSIALFRLRLGAIREGLTVRIRPPRAVQ
jgi:GT2 family glycosyltransferase